MIQATQTFHELKMGTVRKVYQEKDDTQFFTFYSPQNTTRLFVLVSSHGIACHQMSLTKGLDVADKSKTSDRIIRERGTKGYYTITVMATENCHYSIQATASDRNVVELTAAYGLPIDIKKSEKVYVMVRRGQESELKIISSISKHTMGEIIIRAMPVRDEQLGQFF